MPGRGDQPDNCGMPATLVLRGGTVVDGTGAPARRADVAVDGDRIVARRRHRRRTSTRASLDATGLVVAPGFVNALSHAWGSAAAGRQRRVRPAAGRHHRGLRRGVLPRSVRRPAGRGDAAVGRARRRGVESTSTGCRRGSTTSSSSGVAPERRQLHRRHEPAGPRRRLRRPAADASRARPAARHRRRGDGRTARSASAPR